MKIITIAADVRLLKTFEVSDEVAELCGEYTDAPDEVAALVKNDVIQEGVDGWVFGELRGLEVVP